MIFAQFFSLFSLCRGGDDNWYLDDGGCQFPKSSAESGENLECLKHCNFYQQPALARLLAGSKHVVHVVDLIFCS